MINVELRRMGFVELVELKRKKEQTLWTLGFRLASRELFDLLVEIDKEIELRVEQIQELKKLVVMEVIPELNQELIDEIYGTIEKKEFQAWIND